MNGKMNGRDMGVHVDDALGPEVNCAIVAEACLRRLRRRGLAAPAGVSGFTWLPQDYRRGRRPVARVNEEGGE